MKPTPSALAPFAAMAREYRDARAREARRSLRGYPTFHYPAARQAVKNPPWIAGTIIKGLAVLGACAAFLSILVVIARYLES